MLHHLLHGGILKIKSLRPLVVDTAPPPPTHTHFYGNQSRELEDPNPFYLQVIFRAQYHKALAHCDESRKGDLSGGRQHPGQTSNQDQSSENESR